MNCRHFQRLGFGEIGQQTRQPLSQHGFPHSRWSGDHEMVRPGGSDLDGESRLRLTDDVGQIGHRLEQGRRRGYSALEVPTAGQPVLKLLQCADTQLRCRRRDSPRPSSPSGTTTVGHP